jgi:hypothetical protein
MTTEDELRRQAETPQALVREGSATVNARLDRFILGLERKLEQARHVRVILANAPDLADVLLGGLSAELAGPEASDRRAVRAKRRGQTTPGGPVAAEHFNRVREFFGTAGNQWKTVNEIANAINVPRNAAVYVVYKTHRAVMEQRKSPDNPREKQWRLKPEAFPEPANGENLPGP